MIRFILIDVKIKFYLLSHYRKGTSNIYLNKYVLDVIEIKEFSLI
jgi:hypothetical protein